jgi:hypothetical protein
MICSGHWNEIMSKDFSTKKSNISLEGAVVNGLVLRPTRNAQYTFNASTNQYTGLTVGFITSPATSNFEVGNVYIDETSSLQFVQIGNVKRHSSDAEITVLGDITASGGFVCAIPAGASASGASGGVVYPGGSLVVESPAENAAGDENGAIVNLGFNQYDGSTKATTEITGVHLLQNTSTPMTVILTGPITSETVNLHGGVLKKGERLERTAPVNINSLNLHGNAVYDISSNSEHSLGTVKVNGLSNASSVKLGIGTALTVGHVNGVAPVSV